MDEAKTPAESLSGNADFEPATWRRDKTEVMAVYLNPRAFDSFLSADGDVPSFARSAWKRCRWLTFRSLFEKDKLQFQLIADYDSQAAPDWWTRWVKLQAERKLPLAQVPSSALLTMSGHVATSSIRDLLKSAAGDEDALPQDVRQVRRVLAGLLLGADPLDDLLPMLGPRWLFYSVPREPAESAAFPLDGLITIDLQLKGTDAEKSPHESRPAKRTEVRPQRTGRRPQRQDKRRTVGTPRTSRFRHNGFLGRARDVLPPGICRDRTAPGPGDGPESLRGLRRERSQSICRWSRTRRPACPWQTTTS